MYRVPKFALAPVAESTNQQAVGLDVELQAFLSDYFKRPKGEAVKTPSEPTPEKPREDAQPEPKKSAGRFDDMEDDIPF